MKYSISPEDWEGVRAKILSRADDIPHGPVRASILGHLMGAISDIEGGFKPDERIPRIRSGGAGTNHLCGNCLKALETGTDLPKTNSITYFNVKGHGSETKVFMVFVSRDEDNNLVEFTSSMDPSSWKDLVWHITKLLIRSGHDQ